MTPAVGLVVRDLGSAGGIARYVSALAAGVSASPRVRAEIALVGDERQLWPGRVRRIREPRLPLGGSLALVRLARAPWDVAHFPMHEVWPVFATLPFPIVMTVHSVEPLFLAASETVGGTLPYRLLRLVRSRVRIVVVPSPTTADEVHEHLRVPRARIRVIPHGVDHAVFRSEGEAAQPGRPYVLHLSHHQPQKNVVRLIEAFALAGLDEDVELAIGGDVSRCERDYRTAVERLGLEKRVRFLGPVDDDERLAALYRGALAFAMPSLQESFGLPALEAMACGTPVIVSRGTGVADTVGDAGLLVAARDVDEIAAALAQAAGNDELARRGVERARAFSWGRSVDAHVDAYCEAAS